MNYNITFHSFQWPYEEFLSIVPNVKAGPNSNEFLITMKKGPKKTDTMKFSTDHRADLLTEALVNKQSYGMCIFSPTRIL